MKKFLPLILLLSAFTLPQDNPMWKGHLKQVNHYMSGQKSNLYYDELGRLIKEEEPYGVLYTYSYNANYVYRYWKHPGGYESYDTLIKKAANYTDSIIGDDSRWTMDYDVEGNVLSRIYTPLRGKNRRPGKDEYTYFYEYYPQKWDSSVAMFLQCGCDSKVNLVKKKVGINAKGDTTQYFNYKYILDNTGRVNTRMKYYRTGQLYDSIGYVYY